MDTTEQMTGEHGHRQRLERVAEILERDGEPEATPPYDVSEMYDGWDWWPKWMLGSTLPPRERVIYTGIFNRMDPETMRRGKFRAQTLTMNDILGVVGSIRSPQTIRRGLRTLESFGLLTITRTPGGATTYQLVEGAEAPRLPDAERPTR